MAQARDGHRSLDTGCDNTYNQCMTPALLDEIKQRKPFKSIYEEAALNILRTSALLSADFEQVFKPFGITGTQYNVLRILRGADEKGLCRNDVRDRLLNKMPDATRLLDR